MKALQLALIHANSSMYATVSVLLSAVETSLRTWIAQEIAEGVLAGFITTHVRSRVYYIPYYTRAKEKVAFIHAMSSLMEVPYLFD